MKWVLVKYNAEGKSWVPEIFEGNAIQVAIQSQELMAKFNLAKVELFKLYSTLEPARLYTWTPTKENA